MSISPSLRTGRAMLAPLTLLGMNGCTEGTSPPDAVRQRAASLRLGASDVLTRAASSPREALAWTIADFSDVRQGEASDGRGLSVTWSDHATRGEVLSFLHSLQEQVTGDVRKDADDPMASIPQFGHFPQGTNTISVLGMSSGGRVVRFGLTTSCNGPGTGTSTSAGAEADVEVREVGNLYFAAHWRAIEQPVWTSGAYEAYITGGEKHAIQRSTHVSSSHTLWPPTPVTIPKYAERPI